MAAAFGTVAELAPDEVLQATKVIDLGQVDGMMSALKRMRIRRHGVIVNVASALAYRSWPLESAYCGARRRSAALPTRCARKSSTTAWISS